MKCRFICLNFKEILLIILFINITCADIGENKCGADKIKIKPQILDINPEDKPNLSFSKYTSSYQPIKIALDFSNMKKPSSMSTSSFTKIKSILSETAGEFKKFLQVVHDNISLGNNGDTIKRACYLDNIGSGYSNYLIDNDLIIFPFFSRSLGTNTLAGATSCLLLKGTYRPIAGIVLINQTLNFESTNIELYLKNILFHEFTHILVFSPDILEKLNLMKNISSTYYINSPKVLEKAREHFNCDTLTRLYLENQGGQGSAGSHWEARYMLGDYMISTNYAETALSDITLALFEDSGLYKVNYYSANLFQFGKNKGCEFFEKKCIEDETVMFDEFCNQKGSLCTSGRTNKASCFLGGYPTDYIPSQYRYFPSNPNLGGFEAANFCPIPYPYTNTNSYYTYSCKKGQSTKSSEYGETIGDSSYCFFSSLLPSSSSTSISSLDTICYEVSCDTSNKNIIVKIGSNEVICPTEGGNIESPSGFKGSIECPKYEVICPTSDDDILCNDMFDCLTKYADRDNVDYKAAISTYESSINDKDDDDYEDDDDDEDDDYIPIYGTNSNKYINFNLGLLLGFLVLGI